MRLPIGKALVSSGAALRWRDLVNPDPLSSALSMRSKKWVLPAGPCTPRTLMQRRNLGTCVHLACTWTQASRPHSPAAGWSWSPPGEPAVPCRGEAHTGYQDGQDHWALCHNATRGPPGCTPEAAGPVAELCAAGVSPDPGAHGEQEGGQGDSVYGC